MGVHNAAEWQPCCLPARRIDEQVVILGEQYSSECRGTIQQFWIAEGTRAILPGREDVDTA